MATPGRAAGGRKKAARPAPGGPRGGAPAQERELRAQGKKTMRKLLDAAMVVFERRGYYAARVDDIVKVARTSHGTFYLYFANKEDLFRALVADVSEEMTVLARSLGPIGPDDEGYLELRAWLERFSDLYVRYGPVLRAWTEAETDDSQLGLLGNEVTRSFSRYLIARVRESSADSTVNPEIATLALLAMIERFHYYLLSRNLELDHEEMLDTLTTIVHTGLFGGARVARPRPLARRA
jgi:AcrR family transcriptional regulator